MEKSSKKSLVTLWFVTLFFALVWAGTFLANGFLAPVTVEVRDKLLESLLAFLNAHWTNIVTFCTAFVPADGTFTLANYLTYANCGVALAWLVLSIVLIVVGCKTHHKRYIWNLIPMTLVAAVVIGSVSNYVTVLDWISAYLRPAGETYTFAFYQGLEPITDSNPVNVIQSLWGLIAGGAVIVTAILGLVTYGLLLLSAATKDAKCACEACEETCEETEEVPADEVTFSEEETPVVEPAASLVEEVYVEEPVEEEPKEEELVVEEEPASEEPAVEETIEKPVVEEKVGLDEVKLAALLKEMVKEMVKEELASRPQPQPAPAFNGPLVVQYFNNGVPAAQPAPTQVVVNSAPAPVAPAPAPVAEPKKEEPAPAPAPVPAPTPAPAAVEEKPAPVAAPVATPVEKKPIERIPFTQRLLDSEKSLQESYNTIKNELLSWGLKSRISNSGDTFRLHTKTYCKITVAGKSLKLYFALDPKDYADSKIPVNDASEKNLYVDIPLVFKVKSALSLKRCAQLIQDAAEKDGLEQGEIGSVNWIKEMKAELKAAKKSK